MLRPRIKYAHRPIPRPSGALWIGSPHYGLGSEIEDQSGVVWRVCGLMDGTRTTPEIVDAAVAGTGHRAADVAEVIEFLVSSGWVEDAGAGQPDSLSAREVERYSRSMQLLSWIDQTPRSSPYELQARLNASRVTIIGTGGIGSAVATSLVASGVGWVHCVDGDVVELSNLNRQVLFTGADIGRRKVAAAVDRLRLLNDDIQVTGTDVMIGNLDDMLREVRGSDVFVHCADRPEEIVEWSNQAALHLGIPWVVASYTGPMVAVGMLVPGRTGCLTCMTSAERKRMDANGIGDLYHHKRVPGFNPVMAPLAQMSGHLAALEVIYLLLGMPAQTAGRRLHRNVIDYDHQYYIEAVRQPDCPDCGPSVVVADLAGSTA